MRTRRTIGIPLALLLGCALWGCSAFDNWIPNTLYFKVGGDTGRAVQLLYSTQFIAGVDEQGVTEIHVFQTDTVLTTLPVDTAFDISVDRRWFVQLTPVDSTQGTYQVRVDVDDRNQVDETGLVNASDPWRYAYMFNQQLTRKVDVVF